MTASEPTDEAPRATALPDTPATPDDEAMAAPIAQLRAEGIRCLPDGGSSGYYVRVPLADGTQITFAGTTTNDTAYPDVSIHHPVRDHAGWSAQWGQGGQVFDEVHHAHDQHLPYEEDTAALVAAILKRARRSGGSAPEEGVGETAEQLAIKALAKRGITAHPDHVAGNTWLVIGRDQTTSEFPDMENEQYIVLSVYNDDEDEWTIDRPPVCPADQWRVDVVDGTGAERTLMTRPADQLAECVAAIADWLTSAQH
ncbi:hypothetical protein ABZ864_40245 [Streptomyces sp. NPDC047082]|uniref:hypothetical protein n=1 Tax=Streptomyces sp. NPDC047082 TaxID=3155259 RepID=UPI0033EC9409